MTVNTHLAEIRTALSLLSAQQAQDNLTRADMVAALNAVEHHCDAIARLTAPADVVTLPVLSLHDVVAEGRATAARQAAGRHHLQVVTNSGDAA